MHAIQKLVLAAVATVAAGSATAATLGVPAKAFALGNEGTTLVTVADRLNQTAVGVTLTFGGAVLSLDDIDYRPRTMELFGYDNETATVYKIDATTGSTAAIVTNPLTSNDDLGFDFNNLIDAARIVTAEEENVVFAPNNMPPTLTRFTDLFYVAGDVNAGNNPNVVMNAYTNAVPLPTSTVQYVIDTDWNALARLGNNLGTLTTVGDLYLDGALFDIAEAGGFDILSYADGDNTAYALLSDGRTQGIYSLPLVADAMGRINLSFVTAVTTAFGTLDGFTVMPSPIPLPATALLLLGGLGSIVVVKRRRAAV